jgi:NADH-quinone oxidoreductase subunit M
MNHIATILVAIPVLAMLALFFFPQGAKRAMYGFTFIVTVLGFGLSLLLLKGDFSQGQFQFIERYAWIQSFGIRYQVGVDGLSLFLIILTKFLMPIAVISSYSAVKDRLRAYLIAFLLLDAAMVGTFVSLDLFLFFIFWELMLIPMYLIIGVWGSENRIYAAVKFFIYTMVGSALMFVAILFLVAQYKKLTGVYSFDYFELRRLVLAPMVQMWLFLAFALSFAIKVPLWPFHTWLPDAHVEAPTAGSVILAAVLLKMGTYGFLRFAMPLFPHAAFNVGPSIAILALVGIVVGSFVAWMQKDLKKLVAYSSVAHLGFVMLGMFALSNRGITGGVYQMLSHGISTGALFLLVGVIYERRHTKLIEEFGGIAKVMPAYCAFFVIITLSSVALPGTNGFVGEFLILWGTFTSQVLPHPRWITAIAATGVILGVVYMLSAVMRVFFGNLKNPKNKALKDLSVREWAYLVPMVIVVVFMGVYPNPFLKRIEPSVELIRMDYLQKAKKSEYATSAFLDKPLLFLLPDEYLLDLPGTVAATAPAPAPAKPMASSITAIPTHQKPKPSVKMPAPPPTPMLKSPGTPPPMVKPGGPPKPAQPEGGES